MTTRSIMWAMVAVLAIGGAAQAVTFNVNMTGPQEVPGPGDPDGVASGTLTLDPVTGTISWDISFTAIDGTLSGFHIHGPLPALPAQQTAGIFVGLGISGPDTTTPDGQLVGQVTNVATQIATILADLPSFYINLHSTPDFPGGTVRGPVPEPASLALLSLGALALLRRRSA